MSGMLSLDEIEQGLIRIGVPKAKARAQALREAGMPPVRTVAEVLAMPTIEWPFRLTLPWSYLVSDNRKYGVLNGKIILTADYRACKGLMRDAAKEALGQPAPEPAAIPLSLEAFVWVPDDTRAHDVANFAKATHDAFEGVVYTKDRWLHEVRWVRCGCDVDAPRAEIRIRPKAA